MESQQSRVLTELREMILRGEFAAGERLAEIPIAERLGVSRTPVRLAFATLEQEGILEASPAGGFLVRRFQQHEIADAIAVRGLLEGMAARLVAEHGMSRQLALGLKECLRDGDRLFEKPEMLEEDHLAYIDMNSRFHRLLMEGAGSLALKRAIEFNNKWPFASADAFLPMHSTIREGQKLLEFAHMQHHLIVEAIENSEGARAQALAEEHARMATRNLKIALESDGKFTEQLPALHLLAGGKLG